MKKLDINYESLIFVFLFLYIGFIYFSIALSNIFLGIGIFIFALGWNKKRIQLDFNKKNIILFLLLVLPFILTLISSIHSDNLSQGMKSIRLRSPIPIITFVFVFLKIKEGTIKKGVIVFFALTVISTIFTLLNAYKFLGEGIVLKPDYTFFITPIQHPYFGIYLLIALVSLIEFKFIKNNSLRYVSLFILVLGIVISTSRLAYLLLLFIVIFYSFKNFSFKNFLLISIPLLVLSIVFISTNSNIRAKFSRSFTYIDSPRLKLWNNAIKVIKETDNKFLGIGTGDYYTTKNDPYFFKEKGIGQFGYDPHSQFFDFYITTGYFGIFLLIIFFLWNVYAIYDQNTYARMLFLIILAFSLTESILNRQYGVQLYSIFLPLLFNTNFKKTR